MTSSALQPTISLATRTLALYTRTGLTIAEIAIRHYGEDTIYTRRQVNSLIDQARAEAAKAH